MNKDNDSGIKISMKSFLSSLVILLILMIASGMLTRILPPGEYDRIIVEGRETIDINSFEFIEKQDYPVYRWFTAPNERQGNNHQWQNYGYNTLLCF